MISNLQQALDNIPASALPGENSQLDAALLFWQGIQSAQGTYDEAGNFDLAEGGDASAAADATAAIGFIQAELTRMGGT